MTENHLPAPGSSERTRVRRIPEKAVEDRAVVEAILDLVRACRPGEPEGRELADSLSWGPGPRAAQALMLATRARAVLNLWLASQSSSVAAIVSVVMIVPSVLLVGVAAWASTSIISRNPVPPASAAASVWITTAPARPTRAR